MTISSPGIGSSLDVNGIVSKLMSVERAPLDALAAKTDAVQAKISALGAIKSALSTFQSAIASMTTLAGMQPFAGSASEPATVTVAASGAQASAGDYSLSVTQLAQAQKLVAAGQSSATAAIGQGTISFEFGTISNGTLDASGKYTSASFTADGAAPPSVTISAGATSLSDIRDAINSSKIGVTASIINDGSGTPYRLVLTDTATGKAGSMRISVNGDPALAQLLDHDPSSSTGQALSETRSASDALFSVDGVSMSRSSNTVSDAIGGVTLTLLKATAVDPVNVHVASNAAGISSSVTKFAAAYNQLAKTLRAATAYDPTHRVAAPLNGDPAVRNLQAHLRGLLSVPLAGVAGTANQLFAAGVTIQADGTMAVDSARLQTALAADPNSVSALFTEMGSATDPAITYAGATSATHAGSYSVAVGQLATQGRYVASAAAGLTVNAGVNDALLVSLNGVSATVTLDAGTYTSASLAAALQSKINAAPAFAGAALGVAVTAGGAAGDTLSVQSNVYGSSSTIAISASASGSDPAYYFGSAPTATAGSDVSGTINNVAAIGSGRYLTGAAGDSAEGLKLMIAGGATNTARGTVSYSQGYAFQLNKLVGDLLSTTGQLDSETSGYAATVKQLDKDSAAMDVRLTATEARYRAQFTALDVTMGQMSATSTYLTQQLASIAKNN